MKSIFTLMIVIAMIFVYSITIGEDNIQFSYLGSDLWSHVYDLEKSGDHLFCATTYGLIVLDMSNPDQPLPISRLYTEGNPVRDLTITGNYAYLAEYNGGVGVVDISNVNAPQIVGELPFENDFILWVTASGNYVYVGGSVYLYVVDISSPTVPVLISYTHVDAECEMDYNNGFIYACDNDSFKVVDVSDPAAPAVIGTCEIIGGWPRGIYVHGNLVLMSEANQGLEIFDITDPANPVLVGNYNFDNSEFDRNANDVCAAGDFAFVANTQFGLVCIDISDPSDPQVATYHEIGDMRVVHVDNGTVFGVTRVNPIREKIHIVDVGIPLSPQSLSEYQMGSWNNGVSVNDNYAYVVSIDALNIFDISIPQSPQFVGSIGDMELFAVYVEDQTSYLLDKVMVEWEWPLYSMETRLQIADLSDPENPTVIGSMILEYDEEKLAKKDDYLFTALRGLQVVQLSDPSNPQLKGYCDFPTYYQVSDMKVKGNYIYAVDNNDGLLVVDISDPDTPEIVGSISEAGGEGIAISGNYAFIAAGKMKVVDISDPVNPELLVETAEFSGGEIITISGSFAFTGGEYYSAQAIDISNPLSPVRVGHYVTPGETRDLAITGNVLVIAENDGLLLVDLDYAFPCEIPGDANHDLSVNVGDVVFLINYVFKNGPPPPSFNSADVNHDCDINVGDAVTLINSIFKMGGDLVCSSCN